MAIEEFKLTELPRPLLDEALAEIRTFATFLVADGQVAGSGTFVRVNGLSGILTARHVWELITRAKNSWITIQIHDDRHNFGIERDLLTPMINLKRKSEGYGPDIEFIKIPHVHIGGIAARKTFYSLDVGRSKRKLQATNPLGACIVAGVLAERSKVTPGTQGANDLLIVQFHFILLQRNRKKWSSGYDYWELKAKSETGGRRESFGGVSGGGIWKVILGKKPKAGFETAKIAGIYLGGVAFYQSAPSKGWRFLRGHGANTLYKIVPRLVQKTGAT